MKNEEIVHKIRNLEINNIEVETNREGNKIKINLKEPLIMSEKEYEHEFYNFLREELGFMSSDTWENKIIDGFYYRSYKGCEQFENDEGDKLICVYYTRVCLKTEITYFIEKIVFENIES